MTLEEVIELVGKRVAEEREYVLDYLLTAPSNNLLTYEAIKRGDHRNLRLSNGIVSEGKLGDGKQGGEGWDGDCG